MTTFLGWRAWDIRSGIVQDILRQYRNNCFTQKNPESVPTFPDPDGIHGWPSGSIARSTSPFFCDR